MKVAHSLGPNLNVRKVVTISRERGGDGLDNRSLTKGQGVDNQKETENRYETGKLPVEMSK